MTNEPPSARTGPPASTEYLTAEQIAEEHGVNLQTAQRYFRDGGLPGRKIGHSWRTTRAAFDAWLTAGTAHDLSGIHSSPSLPPLETK